MATDLPCSSKVSRAVFDGEIISFRLVANFEKRTITGVISLARNPPMVYTISPIWLAACFMAPLPFAAASA
ncbi:MAG: hypothetical protein WCP32_04510 [Bacteroidota bacterium]